MKYIKLYESYDTDDILQDIKDIVLDIQDSGYDVYVSDSDTVSKWGEITNRLHKFITVAIDGIESEFSVSGGRDYNAFDTNIFREYDLRIKDYLGDKLKDNWYLFMSRQKGTSGQIARSEGYPNEWTNELVFKYEIY
jgi:hypothetical protein